MMNLLYTENCDDFELENDIAFEKASIRCDRALLSLLVINETKEMDVREAEIKCFNESGNLDDLTSYYKEAEEKSKEKTGGILQSIWKAIKGMFKAIKNFLVGSKELENIEKEDPEAEMEVNDKSLNFIQKAMAFIRSIGSNIVGFFKDGSIAKKIIAITAIAGAGTLVTIKVKKARKLKGEALDACDTAEKACDDALNDDNTNGVIQAGIAAFKGLLSKVKDTVMEIFGNVKAKLKKNKEQAKKALGIEDKKGDQNSLADSKSGQMSIEQDHTKDSVAEPDYKTKRSKKYDKKYRDEERKRKKNKEVDQETQRDIAAFHGESVEDSDVESNTFIESVFGDDSQFFQVNEVYNESEEDTYEESVESSDFESMIDDILSL